MFLLFDNNEILNMDNVAYIEAKQYSGNKVQIIIATTAISYYQGDLMSAPNHVSCFSKDFIIESEKWFELLDSIKQGRDTFVCS
ncbi:MAG: hypothetical protein LBB89_07720 [Treponema sp.]|jgi:hypothetical protein|nr:hypothetical protein [Treponema sp.]